jgi:hypothetical protein
LVRSLSIESDYNQCGTSDLGCSSDQTCCRTYGSSDGEYACCAFPQVRLYLFIWFLNFISFV